MIIIISLLFGKYVGKDIYGNRYYSNKFKIFGKEKRWVLFRGQKEPSKVPPHWDMWLKFMVQDYTEPSVFPWQIERIPNLTGTHLAHDPRKFNDKIKSYNNYSSWKPQEDKNDAQ